jgi:hypothetical protein
LAPLIVPRWRLATGGGGRRRRQVSMEQMKRTQALIRLGVTEEDLKVAERLFAELPGGDEVRERRKRRHSQCYLQRR